MRVGVFLHNYSSEVGGGFTIKNDIYQSLLQLHNESPHAYIVVNRLKTRLEVHTIEDSVPRTYSLTGSQLWQNRLRKRLRLPPAAPPYVQWIESAIRDFDIEFMWFVDAGFFPLRVPFMTIVWDNQGRLQPWFPEVSDNGMWEAWEQNHANMRRAARVIVGNPVGKDEIVHFAGIAPGIVRMLPHPTPRFALEAADAGRGVLDKYRLPEGYLLYPAQFWPHKNHVNLLHALQILRDQHDLRLPLVLSGSDFGNKAHVEQSAKSLGLAEQVHFVGFVPREDLVGLYQNASALVYVTLFGPENLPPLEAFALGCPVVASRVAGAEEQFGDAALLVDPLNPADIAAAVARLHGSPDLRQTLIERGKKRARSWTAEDFVRGVFAILDEFALIRRNW